ncbi:kelch-like protein 22 [Culicoides brevitarsis]|uniref:kelch-like protein 22 n=1 Tax=Culicoides brevitarsis TaxID=469753 RepID=UPI00307BD779
MTQTTLSWVEFRDHLQDLCHELYNDQRMFTDCVLKTEGKEIHCHRSILSSSSDYFKQIFDSYPYESLIPEIILPEISYNCLKSLICFIYKGELFIDCKDLNDLWEAATLLDIKSIKIILDGFFSQSQMPSLDDTLDALVQDLRDTDTNTSNVVDDKPDEVQEIQMELIDALIPIVPVVQNLPEVPKIAQIEEFSIPVPAKIDKNVKRLQNFQKKDRNPVQSLREKALAYQKQLEMAICECKKGASLAESSEKYGISQEIIFRNIKNFKLPHIKPPDN